MGVIADGPGPAIDGGRFAEIDAGGTADGIISTDDRSIVEGLRHDASTVVPADCTVVSGAWYAGDVDQRVNGFESGALSAKGVAQHYRPDDQVNSLLPSLASGDVQRANLLSSDGSRVKSITVPLTEYDTGALYDISPIPSMPMGSNPLPVSLVLSANAVAAPYFVEPNIRVGTNIVLSFPMRKHGIYNSGTLTNQVDEAAPSGACVGSLNDGIDDGETVTLESLSASVNDYPHDGTGSHCSNAGVLNNETSDIEAGFYYYDYEESAAEVLINDYWTGWPTPPQITPWLATVALQHAVNVIHVMRSDGSRNTIFGGDENIFNWQLEHGFLGGVGNNSLC